MFASKSILREGKLCLVMLAASLGCLVGCNQNPYLAAPGTAAWQPQTTGVNPNINPTDAKLAELSRRVQLLDDNNRQLHTQLAQSEQQNQVYREELNLVRRELSDTAKKLQSSQLVAKQVESEVRGMRASTQLRGGATIRANTNLGQLARNLNLRGVPVRQDGDVLRITIPSDQVFQPGTAQLLPQAAQVLDPIAGQMRAVFPKQRIGIEAYTDNGTLYGGQAASTHQLASAQAAAILDMLTRRSGMPVSQLFTVAQGANNPVQSNDSAAGRAANRRIELVVYPETF